MNRNQPEISVVVPAYNEAESIEACVREVAGVLSGVGRPFEILVVDDGSVDGTLDVLRAVKETVPELRAIRFKERCGQSAAMDAGFRNAAGAIVVTIDADLQNDPGDIPRLLGALGDWDAVCGVRVKRRDSFIRRASSRIANWVRNKLSGDNIRDTGCSLKVYKREFLVRLKMFDGMHRFLPTLLKMEGARVTEVMVNHRPRLRGKAKYNVWNRVFRSFRDLLAVRWMKQRWIRYEIEEEIR